MIEWLAAHRRVRAAVLVTGGLAAGLLLLAFILVGVDRVAGGTATDPGHDAEPHADPSTAGDGPPSPTSAGPAQPPPATQTPGDEQPVSALPDLPVTDDPDIYAEAIAQVLFGMDSVGYEPQDYEDLLAAAMWNELTHDARAGVAATMATRIPRADMWRQMRSVEQTSSFETELVWTPREQSGVDANTAVPDGVVLRNVTGTQTETWLDENGDQRTSSRPVTVTVLVVCPPAAMPCALGGISPTVVQ